MVTVAKKYRKSVKDRIVWVITGTGDIVNAVVDTISIMVSNLARDTGKTGASLIGSLYDVIGAAIRGVAERGVFHSAKDIGVDAEKAVSESRLC